ncbi:pyridoxal phosphate-dependent decarboxylase family protein [Methylocaldum sp. MU1018]
MSHYRHRHYTEILEQLKSHFPVPVSNPVMDGYFVHSISRFLDKIDALKSTAPVLGAAEQTAYTPHLEARFPEAVRSLEDVNDLVSEYCRGTVVWSHPNTQANVIPPSTTASIMAFLAAAVYNPNIIWDEYSGRFAEAEIQSIGLLSDLIGYDPRQAGGVFTFGGTGTILYGCKLGLERILGGRGMSRGIREDFKIVTSATSHYAKLNVAAWLGLGTDNIVTIPATANNEISLRHLETYWRAALERGEKIAVVIATLGTTDAFGIDDVAGIVRLRDRLVEEYRLDYVPHVHADAVIGWAWCVFRDYDFELNPLGFHARTLRSLRDSLSWIEGIHSADSAGIDLHKTGYAPYVSSAFLVKNRTHLDLLSREPDKMPYLYQFGHYHPGIYTLESSRSGMGPLAALANIELLGKEGYRVLIGHAVEMAEMLRQRIENHACMIVLNDYNYGPVTLFRLYPEGLDPGETLNRELTDPSYRDRLIEHNAYNRRIFDRMHGWALSGEGVLISWTDAYRNVAYENGPPIAALKSFIMSPWTDLSAVDKVVGQALKARALEPA